MTKKLSIIVPVYNVEKYIRPCIESIYHQGVEEDDFEVIIANDGTKDRSIEVIQDIISRHYNITIINQENQGLSVARNNGMAMAIEGLSSDLLYRLEDNVYILFRSMIYHTLHSIKEKNDRLALTDYIIFQAPDLNFTHSIQQRVITFMVKRMPHLFINLYYQYAQIVYKINIRYGKN